VEADLSAFLFHANDAVDFVGGEQMAMFAVTETTLWTMEMPESLAERGVLLPNVQISGHWIIAPGPCRLRTVVLAWERERDDRDYPPTARKFPKPSSTYGYRR
jgi:hypothetical protein